MTDGVWGSFCSVELNHFSNFGRGSPKEHFREIILKSGHWPRKTMLFLGLSIFSSGSHFAQQSGTLLTILVEGHLKNISVNLF